MAEAENTKNPEDGKCHEKNVLIDGGSISGPFWLAGWLFTIGYTNLTVGQAALAIVLWPYYLGNFL